MTAREIELFRTIMRCRTLSAAAALLHVTQPALSKALRHCEDRLGYQLFHRSGGRLVPTTEALALIDDAERVYQNIQSFGALAQEVGGRTGGILRLGATSSLSASLVPRVVAALREEFPTAHVVLQMLPVTQLEQALLTRRVDLGVALSPLQVPGLETVQVGSTRCVVLVRRDHPLAREPAIGPAQLVGLAESGFGNMHDFGRSISTAFERAGVERRLAIEVGTTTTALSMVRAGGGFAVVDGLTLDYLPPEVVARPFLPELRRPVMLVQAEGSGTPSLANRFRTLLEALCRENATP